MQGGILQSQMLQTGSKFIVSKEATDTLFGPGTTGFISFVRAYCRDYPNVAYMRCSITRRGKGGKQRLEVKDLSCPVFIMDSEEFKTTLPDEKMKNFVRIEPGPMSPTVTEMSTGDFLGWSFAYCKYVQQLSKKAQGVKTWPNHPDDLLNVLVRANEIFADSPEYAEDIISTQENRKVIVQKLRILEATLKQTALEYMVNLTDMEVRALKAIEKAGVKKDKMMEDTLNAFTKKKKDLAALLEMSHRRKKR